MVLKLRSSILRPWVKSDVQDIVRHADNINIWNNMRDGFPHPYTSAEAEKWIDMCLSNITDVLLAIEVGSVAVGGAGLIRKSDVYSKNMEIGYWLSEDYWNKGIVSEVVAALTEHAFVKLGMKRVYAAVFEYNSASMRILEKSGYKSEAVLKSSVYKNSRFYDEHIYSVLDTDFKVQI